MTLLDTKEAAAFLRLKPGTLEVYRSTGAGPAFRKIGRRVVYERAELEAWVESHGRPRRSTSDRPERLESRAT